MRILLSLFIYFIFKVHISSSFECNLFELQNSREKLIEASRVFLVEAFIEKLAAIPTINIVKSENSLEFDDFVIKLMENQTSLDFAIRIDTSTEIKPLKNRRRRYSFLLSKNYQDFLKISTIVQPEIFRFNGHFLITLTKGKIEDLEKIFKILWKVGIINVNIIFENLKGEILVATFLPFKAQNCNDTTPLIINEFKNGKFVKGIKVFISPKLENLQNCPIRVATSLLNKPYIISSRLSNGSYELKGVDIKLLSTLSKLLNFKPNFTHISKISYIFNNGSSHGSFAALMNNEADLAISGWFLTGERLKFFDASTSYNNGQLVFMVPPGREFTPFEKLIRPFSTELWAVLGSCLIVGFLVILFVQRSPKKVQSFVFGVGVNYPTLNMFAAFLGGTQKILPRRNFARFLLMMFLIYSLIIRNLYQGSFFKISQSRKHHKEIESVNEIIEKDYKIYVLDGLAVFFRGTEAMKTRLKTSKNVHKFYSQIFSFLELFQ